MTPAFHLVSLISVPVSPSGCVIPRRGASLRADRPSQLRASDAFPTACADPQTVAPTESNAGPSPFGSLAHEAKAKLPHGHATKTYGWRYGSTMLISASYGSHEIGITRLSLHPTPFHRTHWTGGWLDPSAGSDAVERRESLVSTGTPASFPLSIIQ